MRATLAAVGVFGLAGSPARVEAKKKKKKCKKPTKRCGKRCVNTATSKTNCGGCKVQCQGELSCVDGACRCQRDICQVSFFEPSVDTDDLAIDLDGNLVAVSSGEDEVIVFRTNGSVLRTIGEFGADPGEFDFPQGVAVDDAGAIFVADSSNRRIQKIAVSGDPEVWDVDGFPYGVAAGASRTVYATFNSQIHRLTQEGEVSHSWGPGGQTDADFDFPHGVAVGSDGSVYLVDEGANLVYRFTDNGPSDVVEDWVVGEPGIDPGEFNDPWGVAVSGGRVFVTDSGNERVQALNAVDGSVLFTWQLRYSSTFFENPEGIAVGSNGRIYAAGFEAIYTFELGED